MYLMTSAELPEFIEQDVLRNIENVEVPDEALLRCFVQSNKPYLSKSAVADMTDLGDEAVRKRLESLVERGVLLSEEAGRQTKIYWINHPQSNWPVADDLAGDALGDDDSLTATMVRLNRVTVISIFATFPLIIVYVLDWLSSLPATDGIFTASLNAEIMPLLAFFYFGVIFYNSLQTSLHVKNNDVGWPTFRRLYQQIVDRS